MCPPGELPGKKIPPLVFLGTICRGTVPSQPTSCGRTGAAVDRGRDMDWLLLGVLGIIWAAYVFPFRAFKGRSRSSIEEFERSMGLLEQTEKATGRWIVAPRKGEPFVGRKERARERCRARRRRVFVTLLEAMGITFLIGLFPPLHGMWIATGVLA